MMKKNILFSILFGFILTISTGHSATPDWYYEMYGALSHNDVRAVESLLDRGYPLELTNESGFTALMNIARTDQVKMAQLLLDRGANLNRISKKAGSNPLIEATRSCYPQMMSFLIRKGARVDIPGHSPIFKAVDCASLGKLEPAKVLVYAGANVNVRNGVGSTPLMENSYESGNAALAAFLIDQGAKLDLVDRDGQTALICAAMSRNTKVVRLLLSRGANQKVRDAEGMTAYDYALRTGDVDLIDLLKP